MQIERRLDFIQNLELSEFSRKNLQPASSGSAYVAGGSLISFVAGVSPQNQQDVLNSTLLAQLAANQKFDRENQTAEWYQFYRTVLENVGWVVQQFEFDKFNASGSQFSVDKVVLEILEAIATGDEIEIAQKTIEAMKSLDNGDGRLVLFENQSHTLNQGSFQIGMATDYGGVVAMHFGAFHFTSTSNVTKVLFFSFSNSNTSFYKSAQSVSLDKQIYSQVRSAIIQKLGDKARRFVSQLDIG